MSKRKTAEHSLPGRFMEGPLPWVLGIVGFLVILHSDVLFRGAVFIFRDHLMVYIPREVSFLSALGEGSIPQWDPLFMGGQPFAANPGRQLYYPPHYLMLIGDLATGYGIYLVFHLIAGALGMFALLRFAGTRYSTATLGAVCFALCGPVLSLLNLLPSLFAVSWMPWVARFTEGFHRTKRPLEFFGAVTSLALLALGGDPVQSLLTGGLMVGWGFARQDWTDRRLAFSASIRDASWAIAIGAMALLLSSAQLWLSLDFARDTVRSEKMSFEMISLWSFPPERVLEFAYPAVFEQIAPGRLYPEREGEALLVSVHLGIAMSVLAFAGLVARSRGAGWLAFALLLSGIVGVGSHTPLLRLLYDAGLLSSLRYPEKLLLPAAVLLVFWGALTFDRLRNGDSRVARATVGSAIAVTLVAGLFLMAKGSAINADAIRAGQAYWGRMFLLGAVAVGLFIFAYRSRREAPALLMIAFVAIADVGVNAKRLTPMAPKSILNPPAVAAKLDEDRDSYRIFNDAALQFLDYRTPQSLEWLELMGLVLHRNAMFPLSNGIWGYASVCEWDTEHTALMPYVRFQRAMYAVRESGRQNWLTMFASMANVRYRTEFEAMPRALSPDMDALSLEPVAFVRTEAWPRYYFATSIRKAKSADDFISDLKRGDWTRGATWVDLEPFDPAPGEVLDTSESRHLIDLRVRTEGRSYLNVSITPHRYWTATIDGMDAPLHVTNVGFQGLEVPDGEHSIQLRYHNPLVRPALATSVLAFLALVGTTIVLEHRRRRSRASSLSPAIHTTG